MKVLGVSFKPTETIEVFWVDVTGIGEGWKDAVEVRAFANGPGVYRTVGYLFDVVQGNLVLYQSHATHASGPKFDNAMTIPLSAITSVRRFKTDKES